MKIVSGATPRKPEKLKTSMRARPEKVKNFYAQIAFFEIWKSEANTNEKRQRRNT